MLYINYKVEDYYKGSYEISLDKLNEHFVTKLNEYLTSANYKSRFFINDKNLIDTEYIETELDILKNLFCQFVTRFVDRMNYEIEEKNIRGQVNCSFMESVTDLVFVLENRNDFWKVLDIIEERLTL